VDGNGRRQRAAARHRIDSAGLVLRGRHRGCARSDNRSAYFSLTGGLDRWLYRIVRKHGGRQDYGWSFDFAYLHAKSGSLSPLKHFAYDIRDIVRRQPLPGYSLVIERSLSGAERLSFKPSSIDPLTEAPRRCRVSQPAGDKL
jgi:plasmid replication initiation protein